MQSDFLSVGGGATCVDGVGDGVAGACVVGFGPCSTAASVGAFIDKAPLLLSLLLLLCRAATAKTTEIQRTTSLAEQT